MRRADGPPVWTLAVAPLVALLLLGRVLVAADRGAISGTAVVFLVVLAVGLVVTAVVLVLRRRR